MHANVSAEVSKCISGFQMLREEIQFRPLVLVRIEQYLTVYEIMWVQVHYEAADSMLNERPGYSTVPFYNQ